MARRRLASALELIVLGLFAFTLSSAAVSAQGLAVAGSDRTTVQLPVSVLALDYRNAGYALTVSDGVAEVEVDLAPLESSERFRLGPKAEWDSEGAVALLARSLTLGSRTRYQAVSRVLDWVSRNVAYELDREASQEPAAVLERRSGYCTGVARLTVAMLSAVGIEAREVPGYVVEAPSPEIGAGFHRWVEVFYGAPGWAFSDPLATHHFVPATYVRLASEAVMPYPGLDRAVLERREDRRHVVDLFPLAPPGITARRNTARQHAGVLAVTMAGDPSGVAILEGRGDRHTRALVRGQSTFVGLEPGTYVLRVFVDGHAPVERRVVFKERVRGIVELPGPS